MKRNSKEHYKHLDNREKTTLKKVNLLIEQAKTKYREQIIDKITKNTAILDPKDYANLKNDLLKGIDELNRVFYKNISEYYYNLALKDIAEVIDKEVENNYKEQNVDKILRKFMLGNGLNYAYTQEIERRLDYFNSQMLNSCMAEISTKLKENPNIKNYKDTMKRALATSIIVNDTLRVQKKQLGNFIDNVAVFVANESVEQAFLDNGIKYVLWVAEEDEKTCEECLDYNGQVYAIDEAPDIPVHHSCRCHKEPLKNEDF